MCGTWGGVGSRGKRKLSKRGRGMKVYGFKPGAAGRRYARGREKQADTILTNCDLSAGGASVMDFRSSSEMRSISSRADPEYKTASFTKMLTALSMKETNRCMWM